MAYDTELADRLREVLEEEAGVTERRMFGGLAFMINGNMAVAATDEGLLLRVDPADTQRLVAEPHVDHFEMRGRPLKGWLGVESAAVTTDEDLRRWVGHGVAYAGALPPK